ncbi:MAG: tRNA pseudouridine(38-40) synthase TruA [Bacteroidota bacterium]|nr:tRNA pseudouridine(38-40) synthase TruA [Bacteroidota bacterium]
MKYILEISYKGTLYHGWQIQKNAHTVQAELNKAINTLLKTEIETFGSGRTDTGVHAKQQFVEFIYDDVIDSKLFLFKLNALLPKDIYVHHIYTAESNFSVRHDAIKRSYDYHISLVKNPFKQEICCFLFQKSIDVDLMNSAAKVLLNYTDFQSFCKYHSDVDHYICTIYEAYWERENDDLIFHITANRFLRGMVRAIVGTLIEIGLRKINISDFEKIILEKDRKAAKYAVPPEGLFLTKVQYHPQALTLIS